MLRSNGIVRYLFGNKLGQNVCVVKLADDFQDIYLSVSEESPLDIYSPKGTMWNTKCWSCTFEDTSNTKFCKWESKKCFQIERTFLNKLIHIKLVTKAGIQSSLNTNVAFKFFIWQNKKEWFDATTLILKPQLT